MMHTPLELIIKDQAVKVAEHQHEGQKYGEYDYIYHLDSVADILYSNGYCNINTICTAYLHDVVEDTDFNLQNVESLFGVVVAEISTLELIERRIDD